MVAPGVSKWSQARALAVIHVVNPPYSQLDEEREKVSV